MLLAASTVPPLAPKMPPTRGADTLVPPNTSQADPELTGPYTATPLAGDASAATSPIVRRAQRLSICHVGFSNTLLQPLPAPFQTASLQPRLLLSVWRYVPPTAITFGMSAGACTP